MLRKFGRLIVMVALTLAISLFYSTGKIVSANEHDSGHHHHHNDDGSSSDSDSDGSGDGSSDDKSSDDKSSDDKSSDDKSSGHGKKKDKHGSNDKH